MSTHPDLPLLFPSDDLIDYEDFGIIRPTRTHHEYVPPTPRTRDWRDVLSDIEEDMKLGCFDRWQASFWHNACQCHDANGPISRTVCWMRFMLEAKAYGVTNWLNGNQVHSFQQHLLTRLRVVR